MDFVSTTEVQKNTKKVFSSNTGFQVVLNHNKNVGMILNAELSKHMLDSGLIQQIREEMWELNDPITKKLVRDARAGKNKEAINFDDFLAEAA
mgnify:CR=1 FL=1